MSKRDADVSVPTENFTWSQVLDLQVHEVQLLKGQVPVPVLEHSTSTSTSKHNTTSLVEA